ncbi:hypothetical protein [Fusibacter bizertensis]
MLFQGKIDRAQKWLEEKNKKSDVRDIVDPDLPIDTRAEWLAEQNDEEFKLEKGDLLAIVLSAILVFGPIFLIMVIIGFIVYFSIG